MARPFIVRDQIDSLTDLQTERDECTLVAKSLDPPR
jgi:hypothetical protein